MRDSRILMERLTDTMPLVFSNDRIVSLVSKVLDGSANANDGSTRFTGVNSNKQRFKRCLNQLPRFVDTSPIMNVSD